MSRKNKIYNHQILINLKSAFQGKYAELNILSQIGTNIELKDEIEHTALILQNIERWQANLNQGILVYGDDVNELDLEASKTCFQLFEYLSKELEEKAFKIKKIQSSTEPHTPYNEIVELIANLSRFVYCIESFLVMQKEFRINFSEKKETEDLDELIKNYRNMFLVIDEFVQASKKLDEQGERFYSLLKYHSRLIAGFYRAHVHECKVLMLGSRGFLSYKDANFYKAEAIEWEKFKFSATEAGYWRAYEINPGDAREWMALGMSQAIDAASWLTSGFTPLTAKQWLDVWFTPILALTWTLGGYSPREAALFVRKGIHSPAAVPDEQEAGRILAESMDELVEEMKALKNKGGRRKMTAHYDS
jgi:hypothetical protein